MTIAIFWILFAVAVGVLASNKGRSGVGWFLLSLLISPLLGLLFCAVSKNLKNPASTGGPQPNPATHVKCPVCAEWVLPEATVCKHCHQALPPATEFLRRRAATWAAKAEADAQTSKIVAFIVGVAVIIFGLFAMRSP